MPVVHLHEGLFKSTVLLAVEHGMMVADPEPAYRGDMSLYMPGDTVVLRAGLFGEVWAVLKVLDLTPPTVKVVPVLWST